MVGPNAGLGADTHPVEKGVLQISNDAVEIWPKHEAEADREPDDGYHAHRDEAVHHDGQDVLAPDQTRRKRMRGPGS